MKIENLHQLFLKCNSVSIDTRKIKNGSMFFAIKGENFDANTFANEALSKGALFVVIDNSNFYIDERTVIVQDSLKTLQELSVFHRNYLKTPIIALTGSNGKTTTKELINVVLSKKYNTTATIGNFNNHIGVPLTLLSFTSKTQLGIVEMGANHQKEIEFLCKIAKPDYGYITNFGKAHLEGFGGVEGVIKGKCEMYNYLEENKKTVFVNLDDPIQVKKTNNLEKITFGINKPLSNLNITAINANPFVEIQYDNLHIKSNLIGIYNANNINIAILMGKYFGVLDTDIKKAIESYYPDNNRSQLIPKGSNQIILDAYNANPSSMEVAINNFINLINPEKLLILGDMFELGEESNIEHKAIINLVKNETQLKCYFVGKHFFENILESNNLQFFENFELLSQFLKNNNPENKMILIKGSRGMALERLLEVF